MESYSTEEQHIGYWTDGSKLYRKMLVNNGTYSSGTATIATGLNIKKVVKTIGTAQHNNGTQWTSYSLPNSSNNVFLQYKGTQIDLICSFSESVTNVYIWVEYTKYE